MTRLSLLRLGLSLVALVALGVVFERALRYWRELAADNCGVAEAGGNCRALQVYRESGLVTFFVAAALVLAVLILLSNLKSAGK